MFVLVFLVSNKNKRLFVIVTFYNEFIKVLRKSSNNLSHMLNLIY